LTSMATARQIEANRLNALKSTGPKTIEGKARSRANALIHGLTGDGPVIDEAMKAALVTRKDEWEPEFRPIGAGRAWTFDRLIVASLRIERCESNLDAAISDHGARARNVWDQDRRFEAETIAVKLAKNPPLIARQLETTRHGAELMVARWARLGEALDANGDWTEVERSHALDLLGLPAALRSGRTPLDGTDGSDGVDHCRALIESEAARLQSAIDDSLTSIDESACRNARATIGAELTRPVQLLLRYERDAWTRFLRSTNELRGDRPEPSPEPKAAKQVSVPTESRNEPPQPAPLVPGPASTLTIYDVYQADMDSARFCEQARKLGIELPPPPDDAGTPRPSTPLLPVSGSGLSDVCRVRSPRPNRQERRAAKAMARHG